LWSPAGPSWSPHIQYFLGGYATCSAFACETPALICRPDDLLDAGMTDAAPGLNQAAERPRRDQPQKEPRRRFATC
jgi:hypothetical protein